MLEVPEFAGGEIAAAAALVLPLGSCLLRRCCCGLLLTRLLPLPVYRSFANAHTYHINSIALSSDCETFISADDLRVNLWHLDRCAVLCPCWLVHVIVD